MRDSFSLILGSALILCASDGYSESVDISASIRACQKDHFLSPSNMETCIAAKWQEALRAQDKVSRDEGRAQGLEEGRKLGVEDGTKAGRALGMSEGRSSLVIDCGPFGRNDWRTLRTIAGAEFTGHIIIQAHICDPETKATRPSYGLWLEQAVAGRWRDSSNVPGRLLVDISWVKVEGTTDKLDMSTKQFLSDPGAENKYWNRYTLRWDASSNCFISDPGLVKLCRLGATPQTSKGEVPK